MASGPRLRLLDLLLQGPRTVEVLAREADLSVTGVSQHLRVLRTAGLVESRRQGTFVRYSLADEVGDFVLHLRDLAHALVPAIESTRRAVGSAPTPDRARVLARARVGDATLLDVRPAQEYAAAHLAGALHAPPEDLDAIAARLSDDRLVVTYGRGPYSTEAQRAARTLRDRGFSAVHLDLGVPELRRLGFPVETSLRDEAPL